MHLLQGTADDSSERPETCPMVLSATTPMGWHLSIFDGPDISPPPLLLEIDPSSSHRRSWYVPLGFIWNPPSGATFAVVAGSERVPQSTGGPSLAATTLYLVDWSAMFRPMPSSPSLRHHPTLPTYPTLSLPRRPVTTTEEWSVGFCLPTKVSVPPALCLHPAPSCPDGIATPTAGTVGGLGRLVKEKMKGALGNS
eukprot:EG_transcript_24587